MRAEEAVLRLLGQHGEILTALKRFSCAAGFELLSVSWWTPISF